MAIVLSQVCYVVKIEVFLLRTKHKIFSIAVAMVKIFNAVISKKNDTWYGNNIFDLTLVIRKNIVFFSVFFSTLFLYGQTKIPYTTDYKFKDGIYLQFSQFLSNKPLLKEHLIPYDKNDIFFLRNSLKKDTLSFIGDNAVIQKIPTKEIWGFAENNYCYIFYNGQFNRILTIGTIGFFVSNITVTRTNFNDYSMMDYNDPFYYPGGNQAVESKELRRYLIDFTNGQVFPFDYRYFEQIISVDEKIFTEYSNLRKRKKKKLLVIYLRRFNEQHPLMLPQ